MKKMDFGGSRDIISGLPEALICHILSFLPTKEAASTSLLATKWRSLFAFVPNLDFDDSIYVNPLKKKKIPITSADFIEMNNERNNKVSTSFMNFVDRVLALQDNYPVHKLSLKVEDGVDPVRIISWILNVLERHVSDLVLNIDLEPEFLLPSKVFLSKTLVRLKLRLETIDVEDVDLPNLKSLCLESTHFEKHGIGLAKLLSGCHMLEDLFLYDISWSLWEFSSVSVTTLKRLTFRWVERDANPISLSFDTPNLVYLEVTDTIADSYPKVNFGSLVEARINLRMSEEQVGMAEFTEDATSLDLQIHYAEGHEENEMIGNATDFIKGISNVKILYLSAHTLQVLTYSCEAIPLFNNLTCLTIESNPKVGWQSLPGLLKNSPNLETLILQGLVHKATDRCGDVCLCKFLEEEIPTCLSSSPVKVLKIMKFGKLYDDEIDVQIEQVKYFLETMPELEQMILYCDASFNEDMVEVSTQLQRHPRVASSKCNLQLISDRLTLSSIVSSSVSTK